MRDTPASLCSEDFEQKLLVPVVAKATEVEASTVTGPSTVVVITPDGKRERQVVSYSQLVYEALSY
jgi:hypothetical protein